MGFALEVTRCTQFDRTVALIRQKEKQIAKLAEEVNRLRKQAAHDALADLGISKALTARQLEVFSMVVNHRQNKEIANDLNISVRTVKFHIATLFEKFHVTSRADLALHFSGAVGKR